jgi:NAD(P)-dependent dehydrogenase (short-subunit alcohol dehydrogenase family)
LSTAVLGNNARNLWDKFFYACLKRMGPGDAELRVLPARGAASHAKKGGSIVNISSIAGLMGNAGQSNYAATKAGIIGFTKSVAREYGERNIRANAVAPGFIVTQMTHTLDEAWKEKTVSMIPLAPGGD